MFSKVIKGQFGWISGFLYGQNDIMAKNIWSRVKLSLFESWFYRVTNNKNDNNNNEFSNNNF